MPVAEYRRLIDLDSPPGVVDNTHWKADLQYLLHTLGPSDSGALDADVAALHAVLAPLEPDVLEAKTIAMIEGVLRGVRDQRSLIDPSTLPTLADLGTDGCLFADRMSLWIGDITDLGADAVVNAANSSLLGCRIPYHFCIDYALHAAAGPRMRADCSELIRAQSGPEQVGMAKITRGYALPARYVIHTVGPRLEPGAAPTEAASALLRSCYRSCLDTAAEIAALTTVAFCAVSTGVFAYPKPEAAALALETVDEWLALHPDRFRRVVFNLYSEADADHYWRALGLLS